MLWYLLFYYGCPDINAKVTLHEGKTALSLYHTHTQSYKKKNEENKKKGDINEFQVCSHLELKLEKFLSKGIIEFGDISSSIIFLNKNNKK